MRVFLIVMLLLAGSVGISTREPLPDVARPFEAYAREVFTIATDCTDSNVQTAIDAASAGDTVSVEAGTCTWDDAAVTIDEGHALTLQGAGIGLTVITDNTTSGLQLLNTSSTNYVVVKGFTFIKGTNRTAGIIAARGATGAEDAFRITQNRFEGATGGTPAVSPRLITAIGVFGLIDQNEIVVTGGGSFQAIAIWGSPDPTDGGFTPWMSPLTLGTKKAVYIEDNTFDYESTADTVIDCYGGARVVIRFNTITDQTVGCHGADSGGRRSAFSIEYYNNTLTNNTGTSLVAFQLRGGTLLIFNNLFGGTGGYGGIGLDLYRATHGSGYIFNYCDGGQKEIGSDNFSDIESRQAFDVGMGGFAFLSTAPDTVCTVGSANCTRYVDGDGTRGYPCRDQPGRTHNQELAPVYAWGHGGGHLAAARDNGCPNCGGFPVSTWLLENRDFYNEDETFDGTTGVGVGTLASRPATCTAGVAYFATDQGSWNANGDDGVLYQCTSTDVWEVYMTPYTYPHELRAADGVGVGAGVNMLIRGKGGDQ